MRKGFSKRKEEIKSKLLAIQLELDIIARAEEEKWESLQLITPLGSLIQVPAMSIRVVLAIVRDCYERERAKLEKEGAA